MIVLSMAIVSMIMNIQHPTAFAGGCIDEDGDNYWANYECRPNLDPDDNNPCVPDPLSPTCNLTEEVDKSVDDIQDIIDSNPGTPLADKLNDAISYVETVLVELNKNPPDNQAALGNLEGAVGDVEAAVNEGLDETTGNTTMDAMAGIALQIAQVAIDIAINTPGSDSGEIADAQQYLADGDALRVNEEFKDAVAKYKDALSKAEGALS